MGDDAVLDHYAIATRRMTPPSRARLVLITALLTALLTAAICVSAILARAPAVAAPLVAAICVGCPMFAGWEVPNAIASLRANRARDALARLRLGLAELPETEHPLGL